MVTFTVAFTLLGFLQLTSGAVIEEVLMNAASLKAIDTIASTIASTIVPDLDLQGLKEHLLEGLKSTLDVITGQIEKLFESTMNILKSIISNRGGDRAELMEMVNETKIEIINKILQSTGDKLRAQNIPGFTDEYIENVVKPAVKELILNNPDIMKPFDN